MHKKLIKVAVISSLILLQTQSPLAFGAKGTQAPPPAVSAAQPQAPSYISSVAVFRDLMNDREVNELYLRAQQRRLKTAVDFSMQTYFDSSPFLKPITPFIYKILDVGVAASDTRNLMGMQLVTEESHPVLYHRVARTLQIQGFSDKQIKGTLIFLKMGDVNAYAYAYTPDNVRIVVQTDLHEMASAAEERGVLGHEFGHVRSGHVLYGVLDSIMQSRLVTALAVKVYGPSPDSLGLVAVNEIKKSLINQHLQTLVPEMTQTDSGGKTIDQNAMQRQSLAQLIGTADAKTGGTDTVQGAILLGDYLNRIARHMETLEVESKYIAILDNARAHLMPNDVIAVNLEQLVTALQVWTQAYSREMETSADYFGAIIGTPSRNAMMDGKFSGRDVPENATKSDREKIVEQTMKQVEQAVRSNTRQSYYAIVSGLGAPNHPFGNLRLIRQAKFDQNIDRISLENRFLKIVVALDEARLGVGEAEQEIQYTKSVMAKLTANNLPKVAKKLESQIKVLEAKRAAAIRSIAKLEPKIKMLLEDPAFTQRHPRSTNMLDYRLAQKQLLEKSLAIVISLGKPDDPQAPMVIAAIKDAISDISKDPMLQIAIATLQVEKASTVEKKVLELALAAFAENATLEDTLKARQAVTELSKSASRIGPDIDGEPKSANTLTEVMKGKDGKAPPTFLDERPAKASKSKSAPAAPAVPAKAMTCPQLLE